MKKINLIGINAKKALLVFNKISSAQINKILSNYNQLILKNKKQIIQKNSIDVKNMHRKHLVDRLVLNEKRNDYCDFFNKKTELINFDNETDLVKKIIYYLEKPKLRNTIAFNCYKKYHNNFNINVIAKYILKILNKEDVKGKFIWT